MTGIRPDHLIVLIAAALAVGFALLLVGLWRAAAKEPPMPMPPPLSQRDIDRIVSGIEEEDEEDDFERARRMR
jgi:hypothetical protein